MNSNTPANLVSERNTCYINVPNDFYEPKIEHPMNVQKTLESILAGSKNVGFSDFVKLVEAYGFQLSRIEGSHHIFKRENVRELVNLQNVNGKAKPYQMRQVLSLVEKYNLQLRQEEKP